MANRLVMRNDWEAYMEIPGETPVLVLMGEGFTSLSESKNPKEYARQYVHMSSESSDVVGFAPAIAYSMDVHSENPVSQEIVKIHDGEFRGSDARRAIISVNKWEEGATANTYKAFRRLYAIIPDTKGDGTDAMIYTGTMKVVEDQVEGSFSPADKTFTPDAEG